MREDILKTYKELKAMKASFDTTAPRTATKSYWVGHDDCGILVATMDIHDIKGLHNVYPIEAESSDKAKLAHNTIMADDDIGQAYAESFHP